MTRVKNHNQLSQPDLRSGVFFAVVATLLQKPTPPRRPLLQGVMFCSKNRSKSLKIAMSSILVLVLAVLVVFLAALMFSPRINCIDIEVNKSKHDFSQIEMALLMFKRDNGRYPTEEEGLRALLENPSDKEFGTTYRESAYIDVLPMDQKENMYLYQIKIIEGEYGVYLRNEVTGEDNVSQYESQSVKKMKIKAC
ncbi:type II secretion system protein GspG [Teredinibacter franksiae]|uniref:type II secretion system protein GspG n=1 Tax=Teredinibacter franksiae TaxID=2761453 RepID=UPI0016285BB5|nr:type II secretion system protein GspG [Teredinibacter franksiae]